jgi:hypothetical protein
LDFSALLTNTVVIGLVLYLGVCFVCWRLLIHKRYVILLLWPAVIYFPGPTLTSFFEAARGLEQYVFGDITSFENFVMLCYVLGLVAADAWLDLSGIIEKCLFNPTVRGLTSSPLFLTIYFGTALLASILQINLLRTYGTVLTGNYVYWESLTDQSTGFGFVSGLYEIVFLCFVLTLLGNGLGRRTRLLVAATYAMTAVLRLAGGTRLVLVKELAVVLILLYLAGSIRKRQLLIATVVTILGGGVIGLMRGSGSSLDGGVLGPLYGIVIESALNAFSFNIACEVQAAGAIDTLQQIGQMLYFVLLSSVPSFLRPGIGPTELDAISPYNLGVTAGLFTTNSPAGGLSGFATLTYVTGNVLVGCWLLVLAIAGLLRFTPKSRFKRVAVLVFAINAIHFWRDPLDISVKLLVQDMLVVSLLMYIPALRRESSPATALGHGSSPHEALSS